MPLQIIRNDITKMNVDAIVNSTNNKYQAAGGTDKIIHEAAGPELDDFCKTLKPLEAGEAIITPAYNLPCKYIIHTCALLADTNEVTTKKIGECYASSLLLAKKEGCETIAFPLIASGSYSCPTDVALKIAMDSIQKFLLDNDMLVYIVVYDKSSFRISSNLYSSVQAYIDDNYVAEHEQVYNSICGSRFQGTFKNKSVSPRGFLGSDFNVKESYESALDSEFVLDESFSELLFRKIDESGMKDSECYKKANVSKQVFSNIKDKDYIPQKTTILAFAIALEMTLSETKELLERAGFALSHSQMLDVIVEYFIKNKKYDINEINAVLFSYDQKLLGSQVK